jgi:hypothetical protein
MTALTREITIDIQNKMGFGDTYYATFHMDQSGVRLENVRGGPYNQPVEWDRELFEQLYIAAFDGLARFRESEGRAQFCNGECCAAIDHDSPTFNEYPEDNMTDAEADADTLASAGWGTDEDYGYHGGDE